MRYKSKLAGILCSASLMIGISGCPKKQPVIPTQPFISYSEQDIQALNSLARKNAEPKGIFLPEEPLEKLILGDIHFNLQNSKIVRYGNYSSGMVVAVIKAIHDTEDTQRDIYKTLDELLTENNAKFFGIEGFETKEFSRETIKSADKSQYLGLLKEITKDLDKERNKEEFIDFICFKNNLCSATLIFEIMKDREVYTCGLEDEELLEKSYKIVNNRRKQGKVLHKIRKENKGNKFEDLGEEEKKEILKYVFYDKQFDEIVVDKRSEVFALNLIIQYYQWKHAGNDSSLTMMVAGGLHSKGIVEKLEEFEISYIVLEPNSYDRVSKELGIKND